MPGQLDTAGEALTAPRSSPHLSYNPTTGVVSGETSAVEVFAHDLDHHEYYISLDGRPPDWVPAGQMAPYIENVHAFHGGATASIDPSLLEAVIPPFDLPEVVLAPADQQRVMEHNATVASDIRHGSTDFVPSNTSPEEVARARWRQLWAESYRQSFLADMATELTALDCPALTKAEQSPYQTILCGALGKDAMHELLLRLRNDVEYLSCTVIDSVIDLYFPQLLARPNLLVCRSGNVTQLLADPTYAQRLPLNLVDGFTVVAPMHHINHFTLLVATLRATTDPDRPFRLHVQVFDSLPPDRVRREWVQMAEVLCSGFGSLLEIPRDMPYTIEAATDKPVQTNGTDCGVWVLWWIRALAQCFSDSDRGTMCVVAADRLKPPSRYPSQPLLRLRRLFLAEIVGGVPLSGIEFAPDPEFVWGVTPVIGALPSTDFPRLHDESVHVPTSTLGLIPLVSGGDAIGGAVPGAGVAMHLSDDARVLVLAPGTGAHARSPTGQAYTGQAQVYIYIYMCVCVCVCACCVRLCMCGCFVIHIYIYYKYFIHIYVCVCV